jgi:hypothetical protein
VVRAFTSEIEKRQRVENHKTPSGDSVLKQVFAEWSIRIVQAVWRDRTIWTLSEQSADEDVEIDDPEPEEEDEE